MGDQWREQQTDAAIPLEDIASDGFEELLRHAYRLGPQLMVGNVANALKADDKYQMEHLQEAPGASPSKVMYCRRFCSLSAN